MISPTFLLALAASALAAQDDFHVVKRSGLTTCLSNAGVSFVTSSSGNWNSAKAPFNQRTPFTPNAIAYPTSANQVASAVVCGHQNNLRVTARGGGHSYAGYGLGGENGHLVVDMSKIAAVTVDSNTKEATIGAGAKLGDVALALNQAGRAAPHGTCPWVGIGGHAVFGGFGLASRYWGLTIDATVGHQVVLANGTIITTSATSNADLFWAIKGAGASYGIVVQYYLKTFAPPSKITVARHTWTVSSASEAASIFGPYQTYVRNSAPGKLGIEMNIGKSGSGLSLEILSVYLDPSASKYQTVIDPLLNAMPRVPNTKQVKQSIWIDGLQSLAGSQPLSTVGNKDYTDTFYVKSLMTPQAVPMTSTAISSFFSYLFNTAKNSDTAWFVQAELYGGNNSEINKHTLAESSFAHRSSLFTFQFYASSANYKPPYPSDGFSIVDGMVNSITSQMPSNWDVGAYPNYVDPRLSSSEWHQLYYNTQYSRLLSIKNSVDPNNVFAFPQSIGQ